MLGLRSALSVGTAVSAPRGLIIVSRDQPELWQALKQEFGGNDEFRVILDRRHGERRQADRPEVSDRRGRDRRNLPRIEDDLRTRKYVLARPQYRTPRD